MVVDVAQAYHTPALSWHWYVSAPAAPLKPKVGVGVLSGSVGFVGIATVLLGAVVSTVKVLVAGAVALPAASTMRTSKVWDASVRPVYACGLVQAAYVALSIRHWYVSPAPAPAKTKLADVTLIALAGPSLIVGV